MKIENELTGFIFNVGFEKVSNLQTHTILYNMLYVSTD